MMTTGIDRIKFAIQFAQADLDSLRPGDWLNLKADLAEFMGSVAGMEMDLADIGNVIVQCLTPPRVQDYGQPELRALQGELKPFLAGVAATSAPPGIRYPTLTVTTLRVPALKKPVIMATGSVRDGFFYQLIALLQTRRPRKNRQVPEVRQSVLATNASTKILWSRLREPGQRNRIPRAQKGSSQKTGSDKGCRGAKAACQETESTEGKEIIPMTDERKYRGVYEKFPARAIGGCATLTRRAGTAGKRPGARATRSI